MRRVHADEAAARDLAEAADEARSRAHRAHQAASNREAREAGHERAVRRETQRPAAGARAEQQRQHRGIERQRALRPAWASPFDHDFDERAEMHWGYHTFSAVNLMIGVDS